MAYGPGTLVAQTDQYNETGRLRFTSLAIRTSFVGNLGFNFVPTLCKFDSLFCYIRLLNLWWLQILQRQPTCPGA